MLINLPSCFPITQMKQGERWRELKFCRSGRPKCPKTVSNSVLGSRQTTFFPTRRGARGSAHPRRFAAAYGVAYLSTERLEAVKSLSGRAVIFVAAKTFFVRNLEISPHLQVNQVNHELIPTYTVPLDVPKSLNVPRAPRPGGPVATQ